jgi:hypothetical protein
MDTFAVSVGNSASAIFPIGFMYVENKKYLRIKKLFFDKKNKTTVVWWMDGTKTFATCGKGDVYNEEFGLMVCFFKRHSPDWSKYQEILDNAARSKDE